MIKESQRKQWWLAELDRYDNVHRLVDGAHADASGAHEAYYILARLGHIKAEVKYAVISCELSDPHPVSSHVNEAALDTLNEIGLRPPTSHV